VITDTAGIWKVAQLSEDGLEMILVRVLLSFLVIFIIKYGSSILAAFTLRVSMSLGHPQVPVGLSMGNPQVK